MRIALLLAATLTGPALINPALADCPTANDLDRGIQLTDLDGSTETYRRQSELFVRGVWDDGIGAGSSFLLLKGIYVVEVFDIENGDVVSGTRVTHAYPLKPADAPLPVAGGRWDTEVITLDQGEATTQRESHLFGPTTQATIGGCSYEMMPIIGIYHDEGGYEETLHYLPELGLAYLVETRDQDQPADRYTYVRIEAVNN